MPTILTAYIQGTGLIGPGLPDWHSGARVLADEEAYVPRPTTIPTPEGLPPAERRRTGATVKLAVSVAQQAVAAANIDPRGLPAVFSSSSADGLICHEICETLASADRQVSPTRFHNSVHNAAAGYWSLATGATAASTALCAYDASFAAGLLEALVLATVDRVPVLLSAYETVYPEPLRATRPFPDSFAVAFVLTPAPAPDVRAQITVSVRSTAAPPDRLPEPQLEALRAAVPAARSLPLLRLLARREPGEVLLDYLGEQRLAVEVRECR
ncbi:MAG TPA: beta-ketoacyl synthase chain length factor [Steroidobacteraceae bacterium]|nr:beta-ketoacyl synthase chain length factor [Steroidobacteraceae bacterium]